MFKPPSLAKNGKTYTSHLVRESFRTPNGPAPALNLALTRNALLAIIPFKQGEPLVSFFKFYHRHRREALILNSRPVLRPVQPNAL